jgi:hypothetical protein
MLEDDKWVRLTEGQAHSRFPKLELLTHCWKGLKLEQGRTHLHFVPIRLTPSGLRVFLRFHFGFMLQPVIAGWLRSYGEAFCEIQNQ